MYLSICFILKQEIEKLDKGKENPPDNCHQYQQSVLKSVGDFSVSVSIVMGIALGLYFADFGLNLDHFVQ